MTNAETIAAAKRLHTEAGYHLAQMGRLAADAAHVAEHGAEVLRLTAEIAALFTEEPVTLTLAAEEAAQQSDAVPDEEAIPAFSKAPRKRT